MKSIMKPVEMIAYFDDEGVITPYRLRYQNSNQENIVVHISSVLETDLDSFAGNPMYVYKCITKRANKEIPFELKYEQDTNKWFLSKI